MIKAAMEYLGRYSDLGEPDPAGSYVGIRLIDRGEPGDEPQHLDFMVPNQSLSDECIIKAEEDEPVFVLLARDPLAPTLVSLWAQARLLAAREQRDADKAERALTQAEAMAQWAADHPDHGFLARLQR